MNTACRGDTACTNSAVEDVPLPATAPVPSGVGLATTAVGHPVHRVVGGLRTGVVANIDWTVRSIQEAVEQAQTMAGVEIRTVYAGVAGSHLRSTGSEGVAAIAGGEVTRADVDRVLEGARAIRMDERAKVLGYAMTSQCASGSGQFIENIARYLGVTVNEVGPLSLTATSPEKVSGICAVLAETDVINMVSRGISTANILKGIHESMASGFAKLLRNARVSGVVLVTGGLSADIGLLKAVADALKAPAKKGKAKVADADETPAAPVEVRPHPDGVYAGAIGAALWGAYRHERLASEGAAVLEAPVCN